MAENHALIAESATMYTQTDALKESKDLSQNLVSGDFEMQYRNRVMEQSGRRRQACFITSAVTIGAIIVWLLVLTVLREVQIARLRQEVEQLSAHIVAVEATLNGLDQKVSNNRLFNDFKTLEDTVSDIRLVYIWYLVYLIALWCHISCHQTHSSVTWETMIAGLE